MIDASSFIKNRKQVAAITQDRIGHILWYIAECYGLLQKTKPLPTFSKSFAATKTTHKFEDFLKFKFVDNYLIPNKSLLQKKASALEEITFNSETQKTYIDSKDGKEKPDKIDIYVNKLGLQNEWKQSDEHVYFAVECKRINDTQSYGEYVGDIEKFTSRNHTNLRLPYEGMIGFIEDAKITHAIASTQITSRLKKSQSVVTTDYLTTISVNSGFNAGYFSKHNKSFGKKNPFTLYHLFFDYSGNVVN